MKQKRKVKSLVFNKQYRVSSAFTVMLCILGGVLCRGAMSLLFLDRSILAAGDGGDEIITSKNLQYTAIDDKTEVLDRLSFSLTGDDGNDTVVVEMYQDGSSFYVTPKPLVVNSSTAIGTRNLVNSGVWGNILGGNHNTIYSDNITIIGGESNTVESGNTNSTILGGMENTLSAGNESPSIMIGGIHNTVSRNKGVNLVIGGSGNTVSDTESVNIVGGLGNTVTSGSNIIVGGSNVTVGNGVKNVFVFSDGADTDFNLTNPSNENNTFYLKVSNGLGLNVRGTKGGVESSGAVSFGAIDISTKLCQPDELGVQGMWKVERPGKTYGCLVGCTQQSSSQGGAWELLDMGEVCIEECMGKSYCKAMQDVDEEYIYNAFCTTGVISTDHAELCNPSELLSYRNAIFETSLIDAGTECPSGENKCVYRCESGYHLVENQRGRQNNLINPTACYQDCELPWDPTQKVNHNTMITGYNVEDAFCSVDSASFDDVPTSSKYDNCGRHKKVLICDNGTWYQADNRNRITDTVIGAYTNEQCMLKEYRCSTGDYNLTKESITGTLGDTINWTDNEVQNKDGKWLTGTNGIYKVCVDYDPQYNPNGENCTTSYLTGFHFRLVGCMPGYRTGDHHPGQCRKERTLTYDYTTNIGRPGTTTFDNRNIYSETQTGKNQFTKITSGAQVFLTPNVKRYDSYDGKEWSFIGWNINSGAHERLSGTLTMPDDDLTLYAIYKKKLNANFLRNGAIIGTQRITINTSTSGSCEMWNADTSCTFTGAYNFTRGGGWIVDGWNTNSGSCHAVQYGTGLTGFKIDKDTNFYTITHKYWEATFMPNGADNKIKTGNCEFCNTDTKCKMGTPEITRGCWKPLGWSTNSGATTPSVLMGSGITLAKDTTYYAITSRQMSGTFNANLGVKQNTLGLSRKTWTSVGCTIYNTQTGCVSTLQKITTKSSYSARGWTQYSGEVVNEVDVFRGETDFTLKDDMSTGCVGHEPLEHKFYAQVTNDCHRTLTLTFDYTKNGGTGTIFSGTAEVPTNVLTGLLPNESVKLEGDGAPAAVQSGWEFVGWNIYPDKHFGETGVVMDDCGDKVVYAIFKRKCEVYFDANGSKLSEGAGSPQVLRLTGSCDLWNTGESCSIKSPVIIPISATSTTVKNHTIGFSRTSTNHVNLWSDGTGHEVYLKDRPDFKCGNTYYAQTESDEVKHTLAFFTNGNYAYIWDGDVHAHTDGAKKQCKCEPTYNGSGQDKNCSCKVELDSLPGVRAVADEDAEAKWTKMGWTFAQLYTGRKITAVQAGTGYPVAWTKLPMSSSLTFNLTGLVKLYAQTKKTIVVTFEPNNCHNGPSTTSGCGVRNGSMGQCNITSPKITPLPRKVALGWSTETGYGEGYSLKNHWTEGTVRMFSDNQTYYAVCRGEINGACKRLTQTGYLCDVGDAVNKRVFGTGFEWDCEGLDDTQHCELTCGENKYPSGGACASLPCHLCAGEGFPYCFPIDFSSNCRSTPDLIGLDPIRQLERVKDDLDDSALAKDKTCRVNPDVPACSSLYNNAQMAQFAESQTKCESQEMYWAICEQRGQGDVCQAALWDHDFGSSIDGVWQGGKYQVSCSKWW